MASIDKLIVRLDADLRPLEAALKQAERLLRNFTRAVGREARAPLPVLARAADSSNASSRKTALFGTGRQPSTSGGRSAVSAARGEGPAAGATVQPAGAPAAVPFVAGAGVNFLIGTAAGLFVDRLLNQKIDPVDRIVPSGRDFVPTDAGQSAVEFFAAAEIFKRQAAETFGPFQPPLEQNQFNPDHIQRQRNS